MHLADYQTPTQRVRVTPIDGESPFGADEARLAVVISTSSAAEVFVGISTAPSYRLEGGHVTLPNLYVGSFRVTGQAVVTEFLVHSAG